MYNVLINVLWYLFIYYTGVGNELYINIINIIYEKSI